MRTYLSQRRQNNAGDVRIPCRHRSLTAPHETNLGAANGTDVPPLTLGGGKLRAREMPPKRASPMTEEISKRNASFHVVGVNRRSLLVWQLDFNVNESISI